MINHDASVPLHQQIHDHILKQIQTRVWPPGARIPSENELCSQFGCSRMTINRPLRELAQRGVLERVHGRGTFVARREPGHASLVELKPIASEIREQGRVHSAKLIRRAKKPCPAQMTERLQLAKTDAVFHVQLLHHDNGVPVQFENRYVNAALAPDFGNIDWTLQTPTDYLVELITPESIEHTVSAVLPDRKLQKHLQIEALEPCLRLRRRTLIDQQVVSAVDLTYPSSRYHLFNRQQLAGASDQCR